MILAYVQELLVMVTEGDIADFVKEYNKIQVPEPLCAQYKHPNIEEAAAQHRSRFINNHNK